MTQQRAGLMVLAIKVNEVAMLGRAELLPEQAEHTREEIVDAPERAMPCRYSRFRPTADIPHRTSAPAKLMILLAWVCGAKSLQTVWKSKCAVMSAGLCRRKRMVRSR